MRNILTTKTLGILFWAVTLVSCKKVDVESQLTVSETEISFSEEGETAEITITGNADWTINNPASSWLELSQTTGTSGTTNVQLTTGLNATGFTRSTILTVTSDNGQSRRVTCSQLMYENLEEKFANVSPKLMSDNTNPLLDFMFTADPTAVVYDGRMYVYATNDHQQYEHVGKDGKNSYGHIRTLVMMSSDDMVNWTYHGLINTAEVAPWTALSWAPSITSRLEADGKTHFYLYYSNGGVACAVLTATSPVGPWSDPLGKNIIDHSVPGVDVENPFDPGVVIDDQGTGWLSFGAGTPKTEYMPDNARIVKLGADMISLASDISKIPAPYFNEASDLNVINGTWVYSYCTSWAERTEWPYSDIDKPTACNISYMTSKTPLDPDSWKYRDNYFKNTGDVNVGPLSNNHTHLLKFKEKYYITYHAMYLQDYFGTTGGFRNVGIEEMQVDEENVNIPMVKATFEGPSQLNPLNPFILQQAETTAGTSGQVQFEAVGNPGNMVAKGKADKQCLMVRGADFSKQIPTKFEARVKGKGKIDVYVNNLEGTPLVSLTSDGNDWTTLAEKIERTMDKGVVNIYFVFNGEDFLFDEWKFIY
ncbi:family 43 glycosylhydrolase [Proteiniphilum sp. UBA5510]|uniref:family 43 glycosylhydrolase n=1 Tax=Proteiniphilum sp. UBA5510 TaxID=1947286 RepID=UPI0025805B19|nr:family 43 glycosylhydrolase [Proteiniphilum sp. UBA5510]